MSIFIDETNTFDVLIYYKMNGNNIVVLEENEKDSETLKVTFGYPNFASSQKILSASASFDSSGNPTLDVLKLRNSLMIELIKSWDAKDKDGKITQPTPEMLGRVNAAIITAIINKMQDKLGELGFSIL